MSKRRDFPRRERDFYPTPEEAVLPLVPHLDVKRFIEPCAGDGALIEALEKHGFICSYACDIEPQRPWIVRRVLYTLAKCRDVIITNTMWPRRGGSPALDMALHLSACAPSWLLYPADMMHNRYFDQIGKRCVKIVSVGRVSWMGNGVKGFENCAWYLFDIDHEGQTAFHWREAA